MWQASQSLYHSPSSIDLHSVLQRAPSPVEARRALVNLIPGVGMKQASHFLQSIGFDTSMAAIDRHLLDFLHERQVGRKTSGTYEQQEAEVRALAAHHNVPTPVLDFAIWNVMRA